MNRTSVVSVHVFRRVARREERHLQALLDDRNAGPGRVSELEVVPSWARGVRVEKAGPFQWTVVATERPGR